MSQNGVQPEKAPKTDAKQAGTFTALKLCSMVGEIGLLIAIPLVVFLFIGIVIDRYADTKPIFTLVSLPIALVLSTLAVARKVRAVQATDTKKAL